MGWYTTLKIGPFEWSWRKSIAPEVSLLFLKESKFVRKGPQSKFTGFVSSVKRVKENLDSLGFTIEFFKSVYSTYRNTILLYDISFIEGMKIASMEMAPREKDIVMRIENIINMIKTSNISLEFNKTIELLNEYKNYDWASPFGTEPPKVPIFLSEIFKNLSREKSEKVILASLVGEFIHFAYKEFPEIAFLFEVRLILESLTDNTHVSLDLTAFEEEVYDVTDILENLTSRLSEKINVYQRTFSALLGSNETLLQETYRKGLIYDWENVNEKVKNTYEKGKRLEDFTYKLFKSSKDFNVIDRNVNTREKEIDLIIKVKKDKYLPFGNINSPLILVECKNWHRKSGIKEARVLESKLRESRGIFRFGLFISFKGCTKEFIKHCRYLRKSENIWIFTIDKKDLEDMLVDPQLDVSNWLENVLLHQVIG